MVPFRTVLSGLAWTVAYVELVATAIANAESRAALARLAKEQAALRRAAGPAGAAASEASTSSLIRGIYRWPDLGTRRWVLGNLRRVLS
jgi:hypothetical protein